MKKRHVQIKCDYQEFQVVIDGQEIEVKENTLQCALLTAQAWLKGPVVLNLQEVDA